MRYISTAVWKQLNSEMYNKKWPWDLMSPKSVLLGFDFLGNNRLLLEERNVPNNLFYGHHQHDGKKLDGRQVT